MISKIGQGSFGVVYLAIDLRNKLKHVAVKTEPIVSTKPLQLVGEIRTLSVLMNESNVDITVPQAGFPKLLMHGVSAKDDIIYAVIDLLGPSLEDLFRVCGKRFSLKTTLMIWYQILERMESMHDRELMHADLKPENLLMGLKERSNIIHVIDFGLTTSVTDPKSGQHI